MLYLVHQNVAGVGEHCVACRRTVGDMSAVWRAHLCKGFFRSKEQALGAEPVDVRNV